MCNLQQSKQVKTIFGIPINAMTMDQVLCLVHNNIESREKLHIGVVNAAKIVNMNKNEDLNKAVLASDIILADGMSVVWASRLLRKPLPERVTGIDLMMEMLERGNKYSYRIFLFGATEEVSKKVAEIIRLKYPNVKVVGRYNGYFKEKEEFEIAKIIEISNADILLVAITSPKKEKFLARWSEVVKVPICHGVGGSFDVMAGKVERAPEKWRQLGLEWLYRVKQEPLRLWRRYLVTNIIFSKMILFEFIKGVAKEKNIGK